MCTSFLVWGGDPVRVLAGLGFMIRLSSLVFLVVMLFWAFLGSVVMFIRFGLVGLRPLNKIIDGKKKKLNIKQYKKAGN